MRIDYNAKARAISALNALATKNEPALFLMGNEWTHSYTLTLRRLCYEGLTKRYAWASEEELEEYNPMLLWRVLGATASNVYPLLTIKSQLAGVLNAE